MARTRQTPTFARQRRREPVHPPSTALHVYEDLNEHLGALSTSPASADVTATVLDEQREWVELIIDMAEEPPVDRLRRLLEYLALLDLLAVVDPGAFYKVLIGLYGDDGHWLLRCGDVGEFDPHPRVRLAYHVVRPSNPVLEVIAGLLQLDWDAAEEFVAFRETRTALLEKHDRRRSRCSRLAAMVPWRVDVDGPTDQMVDVLIELTQKTSPTAPFRLICCGLGPSLTVPRTAGAWRNLADLGSLVALDKLGPGCLHGLRELGPSSVLALHELLQCQTIAGRKQANRAFVRSVVISSMSDLPDLVAVCSALAESQSVEAVYLTEGFIEFARRQSTQTLVFAIFSDMGCPSLRHLDMPGSLVTQLFLLALVAVRSGANPLSAFGCGGAIMTKSTRVTVAADATIHLEDPRSVACSDEMNAENGPTTMKLSHSVTVWMLRDEGEWLVILLPGWGHAWIRRYETHEMTPVDPQSPRCFTSIRLHGISHLFSDNVAELIELIGSDLTNLELEGIPHDAQTDAWIHRLLVACPRLESLSIEMMDLHSLGPFVAAYRSGFSRITRLSFRFVRVTNHESIQQFMEALGDDDHPLSQHLRELTFYVTEPIQVGEVYPSDMMIAACSRMLQTNSRLVKCRTTTRTLTSPETYGAIFSAQNRQPLRVIKTPLSLSQKLALLSTRRRSQQSQLAAEIARSIFEFAAEGERRVCDLHHF